MGDSEDIAAAIKASPIGIKLSCPVIKQDKTKYIIPCDETVTVERSIAGQNKSTKAEKKP